MSGHVSLVGAGPGDPGLLTRKAIARLRAADLVLYDALVDAHVLRYARRAQKFFVGKRASGGGAPRAVKESRAMAQEGIHALMIRAARKGRRVVRLKGGDPFVFGRGGEEALALQRAGIAYDVVPGVTSAVAAPAAPGIPVTHLGLSSAFLVVSAHEMDAFSFANEADIEEFVSTLERFERGELTPDQWRAFRLVRGTYGQRQTGDASMVRVKIPQGVLTADQLDALADVGERYSRGFGHITTRQNMQFHFVKLHDVELAMRRLADAGLTTREACGSAVRNITACPYAGVAADERFDVTPYAEALTRYLLRHPLSSTLPRK